MQTILGSNGQIGHELAKELYKNYTKEIRLVSRKPQKIHDSDELVSADLLDFNETNNAISGSDIVYFTVGLPMDSEMWMKQFSKILDSDSTLRTLIWTPDASRAMALIGNADDAYGQTWHLPCDRSLTYKEMINIADKIENEKLSYSIIKLWKFKVGSLFNKNAKELLELLPRYEVDNLFNSDKFKKRFPSFPVTSFESRIKQILVK
ncbi:NAD(P)H-binding protein [Lactococcus cremoris]|uniref:NAD(P)H-binding protein n=1 Tax=Lactococcus lactis subsp. cremoris TaxID=1359 RepID=UPI0024A639EA|nr:NAD(P)H-binding protein [Lactococcus cremoris]